jgi:protein SCO1/2
VYLTLVAAPLWAEQDRPAVLHGVGIDQRLDAQVPGALEFRDEAGRTVRLGDYFHDKPHILILVYFRCPKLCPMVLEGLCGSLQGLADFDIGKQFDVITVSFDPQDTPSMAAERKEIYVSRYARPGAESGWHFLTGKQPAIDRLTDAVGFRYAYDAKLNQYAHAAGIMILTPEGRISRYFNNVAYLPRDLRLGLVEASDHKIGSPVDQVLLYCFHYDATKGKYTASVMNFMRAGGVVIVLALGVFGFAMWRRERRLSREGPPKTPDTTG